MIRNLNYGPPYILAEIGINHDGDTNKAREMIEAAADAGADGVKFQAFKAGALFDKELLPDEHALFTRMEIPYGSFKSLRREAFEAGVDFVVTPFDLDAVDMCMDIGVDAIKIASGDITNHDLLMHIGNYHSKILSTGASNMDEVIRAVGWLPLPSAILHCVSLYPTEPHEVNLSVLETMRRQFPDTAIGFSDHTESIAILMIAMAQGARIIEKHFTLDKTADGPDHAGSMDVEELGLIANFVKTLDMVKGDGIKQPVPRELKQITRIRRNPKTALRPEVNF